MKYEIFPDSAAQQTTLADVYPDNFEQKLPLIFVLDVSYSMRDKGIDELNQGLKSFEQFFVNDPVAMARLEVAVLTFSTRVTLVRNFGPLGYPPLPILQAGGRTNMVEGVEIALDLLKNRKDYFKRLGLGYYRPYVILITDGSPWPNNDVDGIAKAIKEGVNNRSFIFQAFGAGKANLSVLKKISHSDFFPQIIQGYDFRSFFNLLIPSVSTHIANPKNSKIILRP